MFLPGGIDAAPSLSDARHRGRLLRWLLHAYHLSGEPGRALRMMMSRAKGDSDWSAETPFLNWKHVFFSAFASGRLREAESAIFNEFAECAIDSRAYALRSCLPWLAHVSAARGQSKRALEMWALFAKVQDRPGPDRKQVLISLLKAQELLWAGKPDDAYAAVTTVLPLLPQIKRQREPIRTERLCGVAALRTGNMDVAMGHLSKALREARTVGLVEEELPILIALAEWHRCNRDPDGARDILNQTWAAAERGPYPLCHADALNVLAQIERDRGNDEAAALCATNAFEAAWCDGPPYAYSSALSSARMHLQALGSPEPNLPPFDASKYEPLPNLGIDITEML